MNKSAALTRGGDCELSGDREHAKLIAWADEVEIC